MKISYNPQDSKRNRIRLPATPARVLATTRKFRKFAMASALAISSASVLTHKANATLVFDDFSNANNGVANTGLTVLSGSSAHPNYFMGQDCTLLPGTVDITGFDLYPGNLSGSNYSGLQLNVYIWGAVNTGTVSAASPAFSDLLEHFTTVAPYNIPSGYFFQFQSVSPGITPGIALSTPLVVPSNTVGLSFNFEGTTNGTTYASADNMTSMLTYGSVPSRGSDPGTFFYSYSGEQTGNFNEGPYTLASPQNLDGIALRVYGDIAVPEPLPSACMLAAFSLASLRRRRVSESA